MASANFSGDGRYRIDYTVSVVQQDVANNRTLIRRVLNMVKQSGSGDYSGSAVSYYSSTGPTTIGTSYFTFDFTSYSTLTLINTTQWVNHNADGTMGFTATAFVAADLSTGTPSNRQASVSFWVSLPTIPRATTPTMSGGFTTGVQSTINLPRASTAFTHDVSWSIGTKSGSLGTGLATEATWNPPHSVLTELPNASSGNVTITVVTKNGATVIGTRTAQFTLTAAASIVPTVTGVTWTDTNTTVATNIGAYVQGHSLLRGAVTAAGVHGSTITSKSVIVGGQTLPENTVFTVSGSGTVTAQGQAIDSRGRTNTAPANFTVLPYSEPSIGANGWQVSRANASNVATNDGAYLRLDLHAIATSLTVGGAEKNSLTISVRTRPTNGSWTNRNTVNPGLVQNGAIQITGGAAYLTTQSYEVEITITDKVISTPMVLKTTISTAIVTIDLNGNSVGIGKYHENGVLDVNGDIYMDGTKVSVEGHTHTGAQVSAATESARGTVERATQAEVNAGTDTTRYVSPLTFLNSDIIKMPPPQTVSRNGASTNVSALGGVFEDIPLLEKITFTTPRPLYVAVDFGASVYAYNGYIMLGVATSGAFVSGAYHYLGNSPTATGEYGTHTPYWNNVQQQPQAAISGHKVILLPAGETIFTMRRLRSATGIVAVDAYPTMTVSPITWA